jgi:repressor of nif and glnA expression
MGTYMPAWSRKLRYLDVLEELGDRPMSAHDVADAMIDRHGGGKGGRWTQIVRQRLDRLAAAGLVSKQRVGDRVLWTRGDA